MSSPALFSDGHDGEFFEYDARMGHDEFDDLLVWAGKRKASDIKFQQGQPVWGKIAGSWERLTRRTMSNGECEEIVRAIYGDNGPGEVQAGHDLDPSYEFKNPDGIGKKMFRVNITGIRVPGATSYQITVRTLPSEPIPIEKLGIEPEIIENLRPPQGMNLITGPTGSGKSTLLSSMIRYLCEKPDASESVIEYSRPIEYIYDNLNFPKSFVCQSEVGRHLRPRDGGGEGSDWAYAVRNALRRAPDIILIGEARDKPTIQGCIEGSMTGHLLMSTMHSIGVPETIRRALMPFPGNERQAMAIDLLECLNLVVTQLLLPKVGGGVVGCREYMLFDTKVRAALMSINSEEWPDRLREMLKERQVTGSSMAQSAHRLLEKGEISGETYEWIASRSGGETKMERFATALSPAEEDGIRAGEEASGHHEGAGQDSLIPASAPRTFGEDID